MVDDDDAHDGYRPLGVNADKDQDDAVNLDLALDDHPVAEVNGLPVKQYQLVGIDTDHNGTEAEATKPGPNLDAPDLPGQPRSVRQNLNLYLDQIANADIALDDRFVVHDERNATHHPGVFAVHPAHKHDV